MPLAAVSREARELPVQLTLDDSMAMMPQMKLSAFPQVLVGARVSKSGSATPQSGDLQGEVSPVEPGRAEVVRVVIDSVRP
jgi:cytochrome c-type biogenesis protein CcmH